MPATEPLRVRGHNGEITFDGNILEINREGFPMLKRTAGRGTKRFSISSVTAVQLKRPVGSLTANRFGFIEFSFMGGRESKGFGLGFGGVGQVQRNWKDENTVLFKAEQLPQFENLQKILEDVIFSRNAQGDSPSPVVEAKSEDPLERIGKLKQLLDAGALTQEEFNAQKAKLLGL